MENIHPKLYHPDQSLQLTDNIFRTKIPGLLYIRSNKYEDQRGFFSELFKFDQLNQVLDQHFEVKQVNFARSKTNVLRGMHAEGWNKLVTVVSGQAYCALTDLRPKSPTFKHSEYFQLDYEQASGVGLFIAQGIANSILAVEGPVNYLYLVDKLYQDRDPKDNLSISPFDPELNISWPIDRETMILSQRDLQAISLKELLGQ